MNNTKEVTIRLTTDRSVLSWFTFFLGFGAHTHAAIGLRDEDGFVYSFNTKGFKKEYLQPRKPKKINQSIYHLAVSEESYKALSDKINDMYASREEYSYSYFGVITCLFRIPFWWRFKKHWFCSQFVAKSLTETGCLKIGGVPEYTFPGRIARTLEKSDRLIRVEHENQLEPLPEFFLTKAKEGTGYLAGAVVKFYTPVLKKVGHSVMWCRIQAFKYARRLKKMCVEIWYEQYKQLLSGSKEE